MIYNPVETELLKIKDFYQENNSRWTIGYFAKNKDNNNVSVFDDSAISWCLLGAVTKLKISNKSIGCLMLAANTMYKKSPSEVNDQLGLDAVYEILDCAIEISKNT